MDADWQLSGLFPLYYLWCGCVQIGFNKFISKSICLGNCKMNPAKPKMHNPIKMVLSIFFKESLKWHHLQSFVATFLCYHLNCKVYILPLELKEITQSKTHKKISFQFPLLSKVIPNNLHHFAMFGLKHTGKCLSTVNSFQIKGFQL